MGREEKRVQGLDYLKPPTNTFFHFRLENGKDIKEGLCQAVPSLRSKRFCFRSFLCCSGAKNYRVILQGDKWSDPTPTLLILLSPQFLRGQNAENPLPRSLLRFDYQPLFGKRARVLLEESRPDTRERRKSSLLFAPRKRLLRRLGSANILAVPVIKDRSISLCQRLTIPKY